MADTHTVATLSDGTLVRRRRDDYWTAQVFEYGSPDDYGEWIRGGRLNADPVSGYWTAESVLAVACDLSRPSADEDDESPEAKRWARLRDVLDEMQREAKA